MDKLKKCKHCQKTIEDISLAIKHTEKSKFYFCCQECHDLEYSVKPPKEKKQEKPIDKNFKTLMDYIDKLYNHDVNYPFINSQIKRLKEENGYTTGGILYTLRYHQETLELPFDITYGIQGILTYYYKDAQNFYRKKLEISNKIKQFNFNDDVVVVKKTEKKLEFEDI